MYYGDIRLGDTIDIKFTTRRFSTGAPYTLAGSPVISAYVGNGTTEITAGITLTVDFDSRTGLNNVRVVATSGNGFATATNVKLVITAGTVDSVSVVGEVVGTFSIENRSAVMPTTAGRTLDVSSGGEAGIDWANVGTPGFTVNLSATTVKTATDVETDTADIQTRIPAALVSGRMDSNTQAMANNVITAAVIATDAIDSDAIAGTAVTEIQSGLATSAEVTGLNVNTRCNLLVPAQIETPDSSTQVYKIRLHLFDPVGNMEAPDSTPTVALTNAAGTDRSSRLSSASNPSTGVYTWDYTATAGDAEEQLVWVFTVVEGGATRTYPATSYVVEYTSYRFSSADRTKLTTIHDSLPANFASFSIDVGGVAKANVTKFGNEAVNTGTPVDADGFPYVNVIKVNDDAASIITDIYNERYIYSDTVQSATGTSLTLSSGASAVDNAYQHCWAYITSGTGSNQAPRYIVSYNGTTKVLTTHPAWTTNPATPAKVKIMPNTFNGGQYGNTAQTADHAAAIAALPTAAAITTAIFAQTIETGTSFLQAQRACFAFAVGAITGAGTGTEVVKGGGVATTRITYTVDDDGNRTVVLNL